MFFIPFRMFRNFGFNFNFGEEEEATIPKGDDVILELEITLADAYVGKNIEVDIHFYENVPLRFRSFEKKPFWSPRLEQEIANADKKSRRDRLGLECFSNFKNRSFQIPLVSKEFFQVCEKCPNVKFDKDDAVMTLHVRPGMSTGQVQPFRQKSFHSVSGNFFFRRRRTCCRWRSWRSKSENSKNIAPNERF